MRDLIEALTILLKYGADDYAPTHCEHDVLLVVGTTKDVSAEDAKRLEELGFIWLDGSEYDCWGSFRFGSA